jgi:hypothetical protein
MCEQPRYLHDDWQFISLAAVTARVLNSIPKPDDDPVLEKGEDGWTKLPRQNPSSPKFASLGGNKSDAVGNSEFRDHPRESPEGAHSGSAKGDDASSGRPIHQLTSENVSGDVADQNEKAEHTGDTENADPWWVFRTNAG